MKKNDSLFKQAGKEITTDTGRADLGKISDGLNMLLKGYTLVFEALSEQAEKLAEKTADNSTEDNAQGSLPWAEITPQSAAETVKGEAEAVKGEAETVEGGADSAETDTANNASTITKDDLTSVIVAKIQQNRSNSGKVEKLLNSYGFKALSDLPQEKYEAFLSDVSQL